MFLKLVEMDIIFNLLRHITRICPLCVSSLNMVVLRAGELPLTSTCIISEKATRSWVKDVTLSHYLTTLDQSCHFRAYLANNPHIHTTYVTYMLQTILTIL